MGWAGVAFAASASSLSPMLKGASMEQSLTTQSCKLEEVLIGYSIVAARSAHPHRVLNGISV